MRKRNFAKQTLLVLLYGALAACSGSSNNSVQMAPNVVGAASQAACEQAGQADASACFVVDDTQVRMYGVIGSNSLTVINTLIRDYPNVQEVLMVNVPGSEDDETNVQVGRALRAASLNTRINADGLIASGGVDLFLAGIERVVQAGAKIGVHSWATQDASGNIVEGSTFPRGHQEHQIFLDYYRDIELPNYEEFYFFTLAAAPASGIHYMTPDEIEQWNIATPIVQAVTSNSGVFVAVGNQGKIGPHHVHIGHNGTVYVKDDESDTQFRIKSGVTHIDGGAGEDTVLLDGDESEYAINRSGNELTVIDTYYERNGIAVLRNVEHLRFHQPAAAAE